MLTKIEIEITHESDQRLDQNITSLLHGFLFEIMNEEDADVLHQPGLKPYSQFLKINQQKITWYIQTMNAKTASAIIEPLKGLSEIFIKHKKISLHIEELTYEEISMDHLMEAYYFNPGDRFISIQLMSPTAFKSQGSYHFIPDLRLIYQSLMNKFDKISKDSKIYDEEVLDHLVKNTVLTRYNLRTVFYHMEGVKIPSFIGSMTLKVNGPQSLVNLANLLFHFGEYSGIGIKCSLGMGAIRVNKQQIKKGVR